MKKHIETKKQNMKTTYENDVRKERITKRIPWKCVNEFNCDITINEKRNVKKKTKNAFLRTHEKDTHEKTHGNKNA